jgi:non-ribosomal peptide synthetase component F
VARIEYRADLFEGPTIRGILADYTSLLTWLIANPETPLAALSEAPIAASRPSQPVAERVIGPTLMEAWAQQVRRTPERTAVVGPDGEGLTYAELAAQATCVAAALARRGATTDTIVGVVGQRTPAFHGGLLGVLEAGSAFLPLDPALPERRLRHLVVASKVAVLLADAERRIGELRKAAASQAGEYHPSRPAPPPLISFSRGRRGRPAPSPSAPMRTGPFAVYP